LGGDETELDNDLTQASAVALLLPPGQIHLYISNQAGSNELLPKGHSVHYTHFKRTRIKRQHHLAFPSSELPAAISLTGGWPRLPMLRSKKSSKRLKLKPLARNYRCVR